MALLHHRHHLHHHHHHHHLHHHQLKFSIDNILNPEFGPTARAAPAPGVGVAGVAGGPGVAFGPGVGVGVGVAGPGAFNLGAFHPLPFLAAARQMLLQAQVQVSLTEFFYRVFLLSRLIFFLQHLVRVFFFTHDGTRGWREVTDFVL